MKYSEAKLSKMRAFILSMESEKKRIIVYVDGYNFYYGLRDSNWKKFYWLDLVNFFESFMNENQELVAVKYFSAPTKDAGKNKRQSAFFSANKLNPRFKLILGSYVLKDVSCQHCYTDFQVPEEKKTDVNIATQMISDCVYENCDTSILVSGDSDLTPPVEFIKNHDPDHQVYVYFPPRRQGMHLKDVCDNALYLEHWKSRFKKHPLPDSLTTKTGFVIKRPESWH